MRSEGTLRNADELPRQSSCDVAIVGYGPVGIVCASLLAQYGLKVSVVERWPYRYALPRAGHFDGEIMRTAFQRLGVAREVEMIARSVLSVDTVNTDGEVVESVVFQPDGSGWKSDYVSYQPEFEDIVDARGAVLGVQVFMGITATCIDQQPEHVDLVVHKTDDLDGEASSIRAAFIIGADGANSFIRGAIGAIKSDLGFKKIDQLVIDFEQNDPDRDIPLMGEVRQMADIRRPSHVGRWGGSRWSRAEFRIFDHEDHDLMLSDAMVWELISRFGLKPEMGKVIRKVIYTFESSITAPWSAGRVFLMGDAAHTTPPYLGQGMCSGVRDAVNLSWKLAAVLAGKADLTFLQTYESERSPQVVGLIKLASALGERLQVIDKEAAKRRDDALRAELAKGPKPNRVGRFPRLGDGLVRSSGDPASKDTDGKPSIQARVISKRRVELLDDFLDSSWTILTRHEVPMSLLNDRQKHIVATLPIQIAHCSRGGGAHFVDLDADYDLWFRTTGQKAFVVRPDSYIYGSVATNEELPELIDHLGDALTSHGYQGIPAR